MAALALLPWRAAWSDTPSWRPFVTEASRRFDVPEDWIMAVIQAESGGRISLHGLPVTSAAGAMGLMQVMPETYVELSIRHGFGPDPYDPRDNILAGTAYLKEMLGRYGFPWCFAAYNAGPQRLDSYLATGHALPSETLSYLAAIEKNLRDEPTKGLANASIPSRSLPRFIEPRAANSSLFFMLGEVYSSPSPAQNSSIPRPKFIPKPTSGGLFVPLGSAARKAEQAP